MFEVTYRIERWVEDDRWMCWDQPFFDRKQAEALFKKRADEVPYARWRLVVRTVSEQVIGLGGAGEAVV